MIPKPESITLIEFDAATLAADYRTFAQSLADNSERLVEVISPAHLTTVVTKSRPWPLPPVQTLHPDPERAARNLSFVRRCYDEKADLLSLGNGRVLLNLTEARRVADIRSGAALLSLLETGNIRKWMPQ